MQKPKQIENQHSMRQALQMLKELHLTPEEERILDEFEEFQRQHPISFSSLIEEEEEEAADS
jgi:DNA replication initiation complex subunit (GINS family)